MKDRHKNGNYIPIPRLIFKHEGFKKLTPYSKLVFFYLFELEHRYTGTKTDCFFRSDEDLAKDIGISKRQIAYSKKEFIKYVPDLLSLGYIHWWLDETHTKQSKRRVTRFNWLI